MKLELTFLTLAIALLFNTAEAGKRRPRFLGYNTAQVQRNLKIEFPDSKHFTTQNVQTFMSDCRQRFIIGYEWVEDEEVVDSWFKGLDASDAFIDKYYYTWEGVRVKKLSVSCFRLYCYYDRYGGYHLQEISEGRGSRTCEFLDGNRGKCFNLSEDNKWFSCNNISA